MPKVASPAEMSKLFVYAHWYLGTYVSVCTAEGSVGMLGVCSVCTCLCFGECKLMYVVWGTCEPVCFLSAYVIV